MLSSRFCLGYAVETSGAILLAPLIQIIPHCDQIEDVDLPVGVHVCLPVVAGGNILVQDIPNGDEVEDVHGAVEVNVAG